jgi:hypothetical protein
VSDPINCPKPKHKHHLERCPPPPSRTLPQAPDLELLPVPQVVVKYVVVDHWLPCGPAYYSNEWPIPWGWFGPGGGGAPSTPVTPKPPAAPEIGIEAAPAALALLVFALVVARLL